ncbi:beta-ketoacyl-[acyl-carrier-protein] synthase family protein [Planctomicrobium piriforme]|uniref:3-oxoacyl-[acyl-carrier-protein] synthase II n=1 Tax=Planctomicrobium piriforme TaxID=1576369 RepID=A0A1I3B8I4_9PLAN|nr:beta-ketoacyl-[acyl-carrier-protein] synthase family protein [Planctomicrobium piriforme]SFH58021.1 3-oxoacyl-[acyl-carrier-protein] synthase II [Planctomicrobium piriforme]
MNRRVVITGLGCVTPVGHDPKTAWKAVCEGQSGIGPISRFNAQGFPTTFAAEVRNFDVANWVSPEVTDSLTGAGLNVRFGMAAAVQAMKDSGLDVSTLPDRTRFGVYLGAGEGPQNFDVFMDMISESRRDAGKWDMDYFTTLALQRLNAAEESQQEPNILAARISGLVGAEGPCSNSLTACAASAQSIGEGTEFIRTGDADIMLVGGSHSMIHPYGVTGFSLLTALSRNNDNPTGASRPFDKERDGFVLAEGAAMLVLEEYEHAKKRGAHIYGEVRGYGVACDAYRITDIPPDGNGLARAMKLALKDARMNVDDISYVNAHGTSTGANDRTETLALKTAFGDQAYKIPVSSTKSMTGHLVAACGGLESIFSLLALNDQTAPPTTNYEYPDPECDLDYVPNTARSMPLKAVMSNNSGFGGQNVSLILTRV